MSLERLHLWAACALACSPLDASKRLSADTMAPSAAEGEACTDLYDGPDALVQAPDRVFPACSDPTPRMYEDVAAEWGFTPPPVANNDHAKGGAVAVYDFNEDGHLDIVFGYNSAELVLFEGGPSGFSMRALEGTGGDGQLTLFDMDSDGDMDIVTAGSPIVVLRNHDGEFETLFFPPEDIVATNDFSPADFDGDGHIDLYVAAAGVRSPDPASRADRFLMGNGRGGFRVEELPVPDAGGVGFDSVTLDFDLDGDSDVYTVNDFGPDFGGNVLWENRAGTLISRKQDCACDLAISGMGVDAADLDGDALPEILIASTGANHLLKQSGDGVYVDIAQSTGADALRGLPTMAWGQIFFDHNDDGLLDIVVAEGDLWLASTDPALRDSYDAALHLLVNEGTRQEPQFVDRSAEMGLDELGSWRAIVPADFNGDGLPDLVVTDVDAPPRLYLAQGCSGHGAFELDLPPQTRVEACIGGERHVRWAMTEVGWGGAAPPTVRFGTGTAPIPETVVVIPPSGGIH